ncbi:hypothetical protein EB077_03580 [bacterium]|nr:hypothetical protein [bacterium]NDC94380.1 hypothetical protein [bacterium]
MSIVDSLCSNLVDYSYTELKKQKNKEKLKYIVDMITSYALRAIRPYLYTIVILLVVMFIVNAVHFYYIYFTHKKYHIGQMYVPKL